MRSQEGRRISTGTLEAVLEATGYLAGGQPASGVILGPAAAATRRGRHFAPDALWRGPASLTVYFKFATARPPMGLVSDWRREVWNEGFAPLLWIVSPDRIDLYNAFGRPLAVGDADVHRLRTFETVDRALQRLDAFAGRLAMETGQFWTQAKGVTRQTSVDRQLLSDLATLESDLVRDGLPRADAQTLIGRIVFSQYLVDRRIVSEDLLADHSGERALAAALRDPASANKLFQWLSDVFNGDIFGEGSRIDAPNERHLARAADFLEAVNPKTGQMSLFPYQFDVMPVELISSIYEQFAHSETDRGESVSPPGSARAATGHASAHDLGIHYTRLPVVSLVLDEVMNGLGGAETVLDLTCGSGVFLVEALRRLVVLQSGDAPTRAIIRSTLYDQIYGVDISESAIRVAAFSLYLAALELDPDPQPPEALKFRPLIGHSLIVGDARDVENLPSAGALRDGSATRKFDVIVGNPPWTFRGIEGTSRRRDSSVKGPRQPRGEALDFVLRAAEFGHEGTRYGMVLSAPPFFAGSKTGTAAAVNVVRQLSPVTLVNLTALSGWLFPTAKMPAVILLARAREQPVDQLTVVNVPWSLASERSYTFSIAPRDIVTLSVESWQDDATRLKTAAFGRGRDVVVLDYLRSEFDSLASWLASVGSSLRDGLILGSPPQRTQDAGHLRGLEILASQDLDPFRVPETLPVFDFGQAQWPRARETYRAPILLVKEFLRGSPRPLAAVVDRDVVFTDAYFGASIDIRHRDEASLLAAILSSSMAAWFFLLTASEFGVWKRRLLTADVRLLPIPKLREALDAAAGKAVLLAQESVRNNPSDERAWAGLDDAVFQLYGLNPTDRVIVDDGFRRATWQWEAARSESAAAADLEVDLLPYARTLVKSLDAWLSTTRQKRLAAEVFSLPKASPLRVIRLRIEPGSGPSTIETIRPQHDLSWVLSHIGERIGIQLASHVVGERELRIHGAGELVIIKPSARRFWTRGRALEDADALVVESFSAAFE